MNDFRELNRLMNRPEGEKWEITKTSNGVKAIPHGSMCLVDSAKKHDKDIQSVLFVNNEESHRVCFGDCGCNQLSKKEYKRVKDVFCVYFNINEKISRFQKLQNELVRIACESKYKREENTGVVYRPIRPYAYIRYKDPMDYLNEIFIESNEFKSHVNNMKNLIKFMKKYDNENFKFLEVNNDYLGFNNGVFNTVTREFSIEAPKDLIVGKYFDKEFTLEKHRL
jgi:hypothetical protein